jgi:Domain of unknown function (DUF4134)
MPIYFGGQYIIKRLFCKLEMKINRVILLFGLTFSQILFSQANVELTDPANNSTRLKGRINDPLYANANVIVPFTMVVISILFLLYAFQIYNKWQMGEKNVVPMISRWVFGLCLYVVLTTFLNAFIAKQDFKRTDKPNFELKKLDLP